MKLLKLLPIIVSIVLLVLMPNAFAHQTHDEGLDEVCALTEGSWHTSASGWACCWRNWGCYGCMNGSCVMNCRTPRCKKANGMLKINTTREQIVKGLAPKGMKPPVVPKNEHFPKAPKERMSPED